MVEKCKEEYFKVMAIQKPKKDTKEQKDKKKK